VYLIPALFATILVAGLIGLLMWKYGFKFNKKSYGFFGERSELE